MPHFAPPRPARWLACTACLLVAATAAAAQSAPNAEERYRLEREECMSPGKYTRDRDACLREAAAARDAARSQSSGPAADELRRNALARCAPLAGADRRDCESRVMGGGERDGSVEGGGVIKRSVTREIGTPPTPAPTPTPAPGTR